MLPLSRFAAAALAVCVAGCALTGKSDSQSVDAGRGTAGKSSKSALADRNESPRKSSAGRSESGGERGSAQKKSSTSESTAVADNPFRRDRPAKPAVSKEESTLPSVSSNAQKDDLASDEFSFNPIPGRDSKSSSKADSGDWAMNAAPRPERGAGDFELEAMIKEEIRLADRDEKETLARDLPAMPPQLARQLIQFRRLARQMDRDRDEEALTRSDNVRNPERRRTRATDFDNEGRPDVESRDRRSPNELESLPNWDRLDTTAQVRPPSYEATPRAPVSPPLASRAVTPLGDASGFPAPPTSSLWTGPSTGGLGRGTDTGSAREMQKLFEEQLRSRLLPNATSQQGQANRVMPVPAPSPSPLPGPPFNTLPSPNGLPAAGSVAGSPQPALPSRLDAPGLFMGGASFAPLPAPNHASPPGRSSNILQVEGTNAGSYPSTAMQGAIAAVVDPLSGLATPASQADLQRLIAVTEADAAAARLGPHPTDTDRRVYIAKHVALRMLYLMANQQERALQAIPGIDPGDQEFWQQMFWSVANYFDGQNVPDRGHRAALTATQLRTAVDRLQESAKLELRNVAFCHKIASFGNYERFDRDEFTPTQPVLLYAELSNFKSAPAAGGKYLTRIRSSIEIHDAAGRQVMRIPTLETEDLCLNHRRDYYHSYEFSLPPATKIALGPHTLKLIVEDLQSNKVAEETLRFTVK
jgi:hypothetical protein